LAREGTSAIRAEDMLEIQENKKSRNQGSGKRG
jgi:hypothetical protein